MTQYFLAAGFTKTIQASLAISGAASGAVTIPSTSGFAAGDIVLVTGVAGATGVNGRWVVAIASSTSFTLKSPMSGVTATFGGTYTSGGTVTHIGFETPAVTMDNTVFSSPNPDFTLKTNFTAVSSGTLARVHVSDTGDGFVNDIKPGPTVFVDGTIVTPVESYETTSYKREDWAGLRIGNVNNALKASVYIEGPNGAAPVAGQSVTFSTWVEA